MGDLHLGLTVPWPMAPFLREQAPKLSPLLCLNIDTGGTDVPRATFSTTNQLVRMDARACWLPGVSRHAGGPTVCQTL